MTNELLTIETSNLSPKLKDMAEYLKNMIPVIEKESKSFGKTQSQFMDNFLTISHPTPLRNAAQILAQSNNLVMALKEAQLKESENLLKVEKLQKKLEKEVDETERKLISVKIHRIEHGLHTSKLYIEGAIRALTNYAQQYEAIMSSSGYSEMSEEDYEKEEVNYHIMKAFSQALCAARSRGGYIDEGNHIYFYQIGVNGGLAQFYISKYLEYEAKEIEKGGFAGPELTHNFLLEMVEIFKNCPKELAKLKGMEFNTKKAILSSEDLRLL